MEKEAQTKKQHYIPKFYMKNFANDDNTFNIINISNQHLINNISYMSHFKEKYFYDKDNKIENKLNKLEKNWCEVFRKIIFGEYPNKKEKQFIKEFAIYQRNRTLYKSEEFLEMSWQSEKVKIEMTLKKDNRKLNNERFEKLEKKYKSHYPYKAIELILEITEKHLNIIDDLDVAIIKYNTTAKLISSDNPVVHYNNFDIKSVGYINAGLIIFFPISSELLCVIYDTKMYLPLNKDDYIISKNEYDVKYLNYFQILNANNAIFFKDDSMSNMIMKELNKNKIQRILRFPKLKTDVLGPDNSKIISFSAKYIYLEHTFSFAKLIKKANMIPKNAIDWFPREYDEKFFNGNFKNRKKIIPIINQIKKENPKDFANAMLWNDNEIDKFNEFVIDYWNNNL